MTANGDEFYEIFFGNALDAYERRPTPACRQLDATGTRR